ncbi:MAG TPA: sugar phosphate isomerase/epimerase [Chloroflexia bacterium]|nr:sugar phosphate isomerase/epimerase [Chloroflexia bacterium]
MDTTKIALQLYTVREQAQQDLNNTLSQLAEAGYRAVELAGFYGLTPQDLRNRLDEFGLKAVSAHISLKDFEANSAQVFENLHTLDCAYAVVPFVPEERRQSKEQFYQLAEILNDLAQKAQAQNFKFAYHNHAFEFASIEGTSLWQVLQEKTDPNLVKLELDLYWAKFAGFEPLELLQKYGSRFPLLHMKDMSTAETREDLPVGEGRLPWPSILEIAESAGVDWYIVEQDHPRDAMDDVKRSLANLQQLMSASLAS